MLVSSAPDAPLGRVMVAVGIPVAVVVDVVPRIKMMAIGIPVVRVADVTVMMRIQSVGQPTENISGRHAPEESGSEPIVGRVGIVIDRARERVVIVRRRTLINDDPLGLIVRNVNDLRLRPLDFNYTVVAADDLVIVAFEIPRRVSTLAKFLDRVHNFRLLIHDRFTERPGPIEIFIQVVNDLRIVQQCDDRIIPVFVRLEVRILFVVFEKSLRLHELKRIGRGRQNDRQKIVRIQRHRTDEFFELRGRIQRRRFGILRCGGAIGEQTESQDRPGPKRNAAAAYQGNHGETS